MIVYADVLILVNFIVDYFLLRATSVLLKLNPPLIRIMSASGIGALTSLYIFAKNQTTFLEIAVRTAFCILITLVCFGFHTKRAFIRASAVLLLSTFSFGGCMTAVWYLFRPNAMTIKNSVVYFDISPTVLLASSVVFYLAVMLIKKIFGKNLPLSEGAKVKLFCGEITVKLNGILDTGNGLRDILGEREVIVIGEESYLLLTSENEAKRIRLIPCKTVGGSLLLSAYRIDKAEIIYKKKTVHIHSPVVALSKTPINENSAILNPDVIGEYL